MPQPPKLTVLSLDGVAHGLLLDLIAAGQLPTLGRLVEQVGRPRMMHSVYPTVSSVAWACWSTGRNPGKHGVYGFIDRRSQSYDLTFPNAASLRGRHLWEILSEHGRRVFGMNVPCTYPPRPINGVQVGCFLSPSLDRAVYPPEQLDYLRSIDYRIDSDAALARQDKRAMLGDLEVTLAKRCEAMLHYLADGPWDFFHTHVMGTDRINHFLLAHGLDGGGELGEGFRKFYRQVDAVVGRLLEAIGPDAPLLILSDHGFCPIRYEVALSRYLVDRGWTTPTPGGRGPMAFDPTRTRAFCLIPGRLYVNLRGREGDGCVPAEQYEATRSQLAADLMELRDPEGRPVVRKVLRREQVYWPTGAAGPDASANQPIAAPPYGMAPDLVALPYDGYDLKMDPQAAQLFTRTALEGMHTAHDALALARGLALPDGPLEIRQLAGPVLSSLGVPAPADLDTRFVDLEAAPPV